MVGAALRMADDDVLRPGIGQHRGADIARVGAARRRVAILSAGDDAGRRRSAVMAASSVAGGQMATVQRGASPLRQQSRELLDLGQRGARGRSSSSCPAISGVMFVVTSNAPPLLRGRGVCHNPRRCR